MHDFTTNTGSNWPDLHNRRDNITIVADDCKRNNYPLIAWPEDKELLRLTDLPQFAKANKRPTWKTLEFGETHIVKSDSDLRRVIIEGFAYSLNPTVQHLTSTFIVQTWYVKTR